MLDNESGVKQGVVVVFYPTGSNWKDSPIIAYARSRPRNEKIATADDAAKFVVEDFRANGSPKYEAKRIKVIKAESGREAVIYHFNGDQWGNSEAVAYFVEEQTINFLVMNSRDPKLFADSQEASEALSPTPSWATTRSWRRRTIRRNRRRRSRGNRTGPEGVPGSVPGS